MNKITKVMMVSMITNVFLSMIKIVVGIVGKSSALLADGVHSFSDLSTDVVAVAGNHISNKPADLKHPYGHGKIEYITSMIISLVILALGLGIIYNSVSKEIVVPSLMVVLVSFVTIVIKYMLSHYIIKKGMLYQNNILIASGNESKTDVISSIVVLCSAIVMQFSEVFSWLQYADMCASIIVGILIVRIGFSILKENLSTVLGEQETDSLYLNSLKRIMLKNKHIVAIDSMTVLKYGSYYKFIADVSMDFSLTILEAHRYIHEVENALKDYDKRIKYVTIHMNPYQKIDYVMKETKKSDYKYLKKYLTETILSRHIVDSKVKEDIEKEVVQTLEKHMSDYKMIWYNNKRIGCIGYYKMEDGHYFLDTIYVISAYQGLKIGSEILDTLLKKVKQENEKLFLWVYKDNYSAMNLYERFGFQIVEETETRYKLGYN